MTDTDWLLFQYAIIVGVIVGAEIVTIIVFVAAQDQVRILAQFHNLAIVGAQKLSAFVASNLIRANTPTTERSGSVRTNMR